MSSKSIDTTQPWYVRASQLTHLLNRDCRVMNANVRKAYEYNEETDEDLMEWDFYGYVEPKEVSTNL